MNMLKKYTSLDGVSGREYDVGAEFARDIFPFVDEVDNLPLGGVVGIIHGTSGKSIMIAAHMDEVGVMVSHVDKSGYVHFVAIGGLNSDTIIGQEVRFGDTYGVVGMVPPHLRPANATTPKLEDLYIDIGAKDAEEAKKMGVDIGVVGTFPSTFRCLGEDKIMAKALDDRAGIAAIVDSLRFAQNFDHTIYLVGSTQEEVGLKGVRGAVERYNPDMFIAIDVTMGHGSPGIPEKKAPVKMGDGPVLVIADGAGRGILSDPRLVENVKAVAETHEIPVQMEVSSGGTTDATMAQMLGQGRSAMTISIVSDYIHAPRSTIHKDDYYALIKLLTKLYEM